jgi:hypothetical protein
LAAGVSGGEVLGSARAGPPGGTWIRSRSKRNPRRFRLSPMAPPLFRIFSLQRGAAGASFFFPRVGVPRYPSFGKAPVMPAVRSAPVSVESVRAYEQGVRRAPCPVAATDLRRPAIRMNAASAGAGYSAR